IPAPTFALTLFGRQLMSQQTDIRQRFLFPNSDIRGEIVRLDTSLAPILNARAYPMALEGLLGEAMAAVTLLSGSLKFKGRLGLQAQGQGELKMLLAECTDDSKIRGLMQLKEGEPVPNSAALSELLSQGVMAITIKPEQGRDYQGLVPMESDSFAACLEDYFRQSEQLPTRLWLASGNGQAAGIMLQALPQQVASKEDNDLTWERVVTLTETLTMDELLGLPVETVLHRLFHEDLPQLPQAQPISFGCTCSRERVARALISLGVEELQSLLDEQNEAEIQCDFCSKTQTFDAVDLAQLIHTMKEHQSS